MRSKNGSRQKRVFLYAYDRNNLGDDLFVYAIVNRYPDAIFYLWSTAVNRTTFSCLKNLVVLDSHSSWIRFLKKVRPSLAARFKNHKENSCDAVVFIGGSIFIEYENWRQNLEWWDFETLNHDVYVLGANFGPYHTETFRTGFFKIFEKCKDVCLRDKYSQSLFSDSGKVRYAPDILFSYPLKKRTLDDKLAFVSVIDCKSKDEGDNNLADYEQSYMDALVKLLTGFLKKGYRIILSSFCKAEGDENAVEKIRSLFSTEKIDVVNYNGSNPQEVLDEISKASIVIASRFHATLFGFSAGKPVLPIIYSDKTKHVLEDINFTGKYLDIRHLEQINIDALLMDIDGQRLSGIDILQRESELHFVKLDQLLQL